MKLSSLISINNILISNEKLKKRDVLAQMVDLICSDLNNDLKAKILESIITREELQSTGIGYGVAVPHPLKETKFTKEQVLKIRVGLGIYKSGIDYKALDKQPVYIVFPIVSPDEENNLYLTVLSEIAKFVKVEKNRENLKNADTKERIINFLSEGDLF